MRCCALALFLVACSGDSISSPDIKQPEPEDTQPEVPEDTAPPLPSGDDFAVAVPVGSDLAVFWNRGADFETDSDRTWTLPDSSFQAMICDWDGDGLADVWLIEPASGEVVVHIYQNTGGDWASSAIFNETAPVNPNRFELFCGDFDGDGYAELGGFNSTNQKFFLYDNAGGDFDWDNPTKTDSDVTASAEFVPGDFDGDGQAELGVWASNTLDVYEFSALTLDTGTVVMTASIDGADGLLGIDYDDDGDQDLGVWSGASLQVWPSDGTDFNRGEKSVFVIGLSGTALAGRLH